MPMLKKRLDDPKTAGVRRSVAREKGRRVCLSIHSGLFCSLDFRKNTFLFFGLILFIIAAQSVAFAAPTPTISLNAPASASGGTIAAIAGGGWVILGTEVIWIGVDFMAGYADSLK